MKGRVRFLAVCFFSLALNSFAAQSAGIDSAEHVQQVLKWLPADTETLLVANGPFKLDLSSFDGKPGASELAPEEIRGIFRGEVQRLIGVKDLTLARRVMEHHIIASVEGSRRFRPPSGLGEMPYEGCLILIFQDDIHSDITDFFASLKAPWSETNIEGERVATVQEKEEDDLWTNFVASPDKNILLVATNADYLSEVLRRRQGRMDERALPDSLPEWNYVNPRAEIWGVRHFDRQRAESDPSSPFLRGGNDMGMSDDAAIGVVFEVNPTLRTAMVTYLSSNPSVAKRADGPLLDPYQIESIEEARSLDIQLKSLDATATKATYQLREILATRMLEFVLIWLVGHGVYV